MSQPAANWAPCKRGYEGQGNDMGTARALNPRDMRPSAERTLLPSLPGGVKRTRPARPGSWPALVLFTALLILLSTYKCIWSGTSESARAVPRILRNKTIYTLDYITYNAYRTHPEVSVFFSVYLDKNEV